ESPEARLATSAAGGTLPLQVGLDQPSEVPAARPAGAGSRACAAAPTARRLSHASHDGYEQARRAAPARRGRETRKPCRRYSQPSLQGRGDSNIGALQGVCSVSTTVLTSATTVTETIVAALHHQTE